MKASSLFLGLAIAGSAGSASAACEVADAISGMEISEEKLALRKGAFGELCKKFQERLIDTAAYRSDPRLSLPVEMRADVALQPTEPDKLPENTPAPTIVVYIVDEDGSVSWLSILQSSGDAQRDDIAARYYYGMKYQTPATLDGAPVPVFVTRAVRLVRREVTIVR